MLSTCVKVPISALCHVTPSSVWTTLFDPTIQQLVTDTHVTPRAVPIVLGTVGPLDHVGAAWVTCADDVAAKPTVLTNTMLTSAESRARIHAAGQHP